MAKQKAYRGSAPPSRVLILGSQTVWSESEWYSALARPSRCPPGCRCGCVRPAPAPRLAGLRMPVPSAYSLLSRRPVDRPRPPTRLLSGRRECPCGCGRRDLGWERWMRLDRVCLRCLCHASDPDDYEGPLAWLLARAEERRRRRDRERLLVRAAREFRSFERSRRGVRAG